MNIINRTGKFAGWLLKLPDLKARAKINIRIERAMTGCFGDIKPVGDGVIEMRIDHGPGYRVYYTRAGHVTWLLLCGGDKRSQAADIADAKALWQCIRKQRHNLPLHH